VLLRTVGIEAIPIFNVENACASAATAFHLGWQAVATGMQDVVLCVGAEKLTHTDPSVGLDAIGTAVDVEARAELAAELGTEPGSTKRSFFMDIYAALTRAYMVRSGATPEHFAEVVVKNQHNGELNPRAQYGAELTVDAVLAAREIVSPLTLLMCSPISDGAAAVVLASSRARRRLNARPGPRVRGVGRRLRQPARRRRPDGRLDRPAAALAYEAAGIGPGRARLRGAPRRNGTGRADGLRAGCIRVARRGPGADPFGRDEARWTVAGETRAAGCSPRVIRSERRASPSSARRPGSSAARPAPGRSTVRASP